MGPPTATLRVASVSARPIRPGVPATRIASQPKMAGRLLNWIEASAVTETDLSLLLCDLRPEPRVEQEHDAIREGGNGGEEGRGHHGHGLDLRIIAGGERLNEKLAETWIPEDVLDHDHARQERDRIEGDGVHDNDHGIWHDVKPQ